MTIETESLLLFERGDRPTPRLDLGCIFFLSFFKVYYYKSILIDYD